MNPIPPSMTFPTAACWPKVKELKRPANGGEPKVVVRDATFFEALFRKDTFSACGKK